MQAMIWSSGFGSFDQNARDKVMNWIFKGYDLIMNRLITHGMSRSSSPEMSERLSSGLARRAKMLVVIARWLPR